MDRSATFTDVCAFLDRLQRTRTVSAKKNMVQGYLNRWRQQDPDVYPLLRLLLPHLDDRSRGGSFGLKEAKLADAYIAALSLAKTSADAFALRRFDQQHDNKHGKEDFADVLYGILRTRLFAEPSVTVFDVNLMLSKLADPQCDKTALFREAVTKMTAQEHKWFARLILKQMHLAIGDQHVLKCYHEDAPALYNVCGDLQKVIRELWDPDRRLLGHGVRLLEPFKPMLADRGDIGAFIKSTGTAVVVEEKLDGERIQLHYEHASKTFKYFSRAGNDSTSLYTDSLTAKIAHKFQESVILDGEMMVYDRELQKYLSFDLVKTAAAGNDPFVHPVLVVFDILYCAGQSVAHLPLLARKDLLGAHCPTVDDHLLVLPFEQECEAQAVFDKLDDILWRHGEGLILKSPSAPYEIGERSKHWLKVKPDYINSLLDDLDLVVVGVFLGKGVMGSFGSISGLLCACLRPLDGKLLSFCKVGSGFNREQLSHLTMLLQGHLTDTPPTDLLTVDAPHKYVDVGELRVLVEVKGMAMVDSGAFAAGKTLRSPRFVRVREDKAEATTVSEIETMHLAAMRSTRPATVTDLAHVSGQETPTIKEDLFKGHFVYVHEGNQQLAKPAIQAMVQRLNGITVEHPIPAITHIIANGFAKPSMRLKNVISLHPQCTLMTVSELQSLYSRC